MLQFVIACLLAYLSGSIPTAYIVGRLVKGVDIRQHGSGNMGASNVFRVIGKPWGILVLLIDIIKGVVPVSMIAPMLYPAGAILPLKVFALISGIFAIAGHNWTVFLGFKGGKGVATSLGVGLGLMPRAAGLAFAVWVLVLAPLGYISVASIAAALSFPGWVYLLYRGIPGFPVIFSVSLLLAFTIVFRHRSNMQRLAQGKEVKVWQK